VSDLPHSNAWGDSEESTPPQVRQILVPDAGVGVKWFMPEPDADDAARLLGRDRQPASVPSPKTR
jgi:hypothetical protein